MSLYGDSEYPVDEALQAIHEAQLDSLGGPGVWFTGSQRVALVEEVRAARIEAGVQETVGAPAPVSDGADLSDTAKHVAREAALSPGTFVREFYEEAVRDGLTDAEYVEIVGIVGRLVNFDVVARGLGIGPRAIGVSGGDNPSRRRPHTAIAEGAWVDTVPAGPSGGDAAREMYGDAKMVSFIFRGMSLAPSENLAHMELDEAQYLPARHFAEFDYQQHEGLTRPQVEVVAGRVSAINECFY